MKAFPKKAVLMLAGAILVTAGCSWGGNESSVEAAETTATSTTTGAPTTTTTAEPEDEPMIAIEGELVFGEVTGEGTFEVTVGADILGCESGTLVEFPSWDKVVYDMVCSSGTRSGTFGSSFSPFDSTLNSPWDIVLGTDDFGDLSGSGDWSAELTEDGNGATFSMTGDVAFGEVAEPLLSFPPPRAAALDGVLVRSS